MARKTTIAGISPRRRSRAKRRHVVAIIVSDGVVLGDVVAPAELFARAKDELGPIYDVRICSAARVVTSAHVTLGVPWRLKTIEIADTVIVPGIDDLRRAIPPAVIRAIRRAA